MPKQVNIAQDTNDIQITTTQNQITVVEGDNTAVNVTQPTTQVVQVLTGPRGPKGDLPTSGSVNFTGSYNISGSLIVTGSTISTGGFTGSLYGTSSWAINSETASYVNPLTQNVLITGSLTVSGSSTFTNIGPAIFSGSVQGTSGFTGSFLGDLTGTASYIEFDNVEGLTQFSSSLSSRTTALEQFSSSLDNTFVTDAELNAYTSSANARLDALEVESGSIRSDFNSFTSSYNTDSSSFENRITTNESDISALQSFSSSLDNTFATDAELNAATSSLSSSISALSSSYLSTSASFSSGIELNTSDITALSSSFVSFSGSYNTGSFTGSLQGIASNAITSSYITFSGVDGLTGYSSSISIRVSDLEQFSSSLDATFATDAELNNYTSSANARLDALEVESGSIRSDFNSFTSSYYTDSSSFALGINTNTTSIVSLTLATSSYVLNSQTGSFILASQTSSMSVASASAATSASYALTASYIQLSGVDGFTVYSSSVSNRVTNLENFSSSLDATFATDAQLNVATASLSSSIASLSSSYLSTSASFSSGINANTNSISALSSSFISFSGSYNTGSFTGSFTGNLTGTSSYATSASHALNADNVISASYALTASYVNPLNQNVLISGSLKLDPTQDPDPSGLDLDSTALFQSSSNTSLGYDLYIRQNGNLIKWKWVEGVVNTGLLFGGVVTYSGSTVFVSSGSGIIVDHNATTNQEISPIITYVNWSNISQSVSNISTQQVTYLYIDQNGDLQQQSTRFTNDQYHDYIPLGAVGHFDYTQVSAFGGQVQTAYDQVAQISTFVDAFGPLKISGYGLTGQAGSLRLSVGSGQSFIHGGFYENDPELPSTITTNAQATASIAYVYRSGSGAAFDTNGGNLYTSLRPGFYDPGTGVTGSVSNNDWTIQRVYSDPKTGVLYIYYGQTIYPDYNTALADLSSDSFTEGDTFDFTTFVGFLVLKSNTTDITNTGDNKIIPAGLFRGSGQGGGGGSAVSDLDDLSDVSITGPTDGEALVYNAGIWANGTPISSSYSVTSSLALSAVTASLAPNYVLTSVTSSMLAPYVLTSQTSSMSVASASYVNLNNVDGFTVYSSSVSTRLTNQENFSSSLDATFATDAELAAATASLSASISSLSSSYLSTSASFSSGINSNINSISVLSSSFVSFSGSYNTGSFSGSFTGDGSGLFNIPASGIVGLNLNQITSGSVSASISPDKGLEINTNVVATSFTGSLFGTSSWASNSISSSYADTTTNANNVYVDAASTTTLNVIPTYQSDGGTDGYKSLQLSSNPLSYHYRTTNRQSGVSQQADELNIGGGANTAGGIFLNSTVGIPSYVSADGPLHLFSQGYKVQISSSVNDVEIIGHITASGNISASGIVYGTTGSFSHLQGNSPITVGDSITFQLGITGSNILLTSSIIDFDTEVSRSAQAAGFGGGGISAVVDDPSPQLGGNLDINNQDITGTGNISIDTTSTVTPSLLLTSTNDTSDASPIIDLKRNSSSPSNGDYLGQIKFKGENDANQEVVYAKITGKISDVTDTTEDGLIEFMAKQNGNNKIVARLTSTDLKLINGTGLEVDGNISASGDITANSFTGSFSGSFFGDGSGLTGVIANIDTGSFVTTSSFNTFTSSIQTEVDNLTAQTGSYVLNSQTSSMSVASASVATSASYAFTASYIDGGFY